MSQDNYEIWPVCACVKLLTVFGVQKFSSLENAKKFFRDKVLHQKRNLKNGVSNFLLGCMLFHYDAFLIIDLDGAEKIDNI